MVSEAERAQCCASSGASPRVGWTGRSRIESKPVGTTSRATGSRHFGSVALARIQAPNGHGQWNLRPLAHRTAALGVVESLSHQAVHMHLKKRTQVANEQALVHSQD